MQRSGRVHLITICELLTQPFFQDINWVWGEANVVVMHAKYSTPCQLDRRRWNYGKQLDRQILPKLRQLDHQSSVLLCTRKTRCQLVYEHMIWWSIKIFCSPFSCTSASRPIMQFHLFFPRKWDGSCVTEWEPHGRRMCWARLSMGESDSWAGESNHAYVPRRIKLEPGLLIREQTPGKQMATC